MENRIEEIKNESNSYLSFRIGDEVFAAHVAHITNIVEVPKITKIPRSPEYMLGVMNLRGTVLPVIDTRIKFGMPSIEVTTNTCILVIDFTVDEEVFHAGIMVDGVREVLEINKAQIMDPPNSGEIKVSEFIYGIVNIDDHLIMLLDINLILNYKEIADMQKQISSIKKKVKETENEKEIKTEKEKKVEAQ